MMSMYKDMYGKAMDPYGMKDHSGYGMKDHSGYGMKYHSGYHDGKYLIPCSIYTSCI